jgi:hypothetical protein
VTVSFALITFRFDTTWVRVPQNFPHVCCAGVIVGVGVVMVVSFGCEGDVAAVGEVVGSGVVCTGVVEGVGVAAAVLGETFVGVLVVW